VKTLAKTFDLFDTADTFEQQLGYIIAIGLAFKLFYFIGFVLSTKALKKVICAPLRTTNLTRNPSLLQPAPHISLRILIAPPRPVVPGATR